MPTRNIVLPITLDTETVVYASVLSLDGEEEVASRSIVFDGVIPIVQGIAAQLAQAFAAIQPDKASVEFGLKLSTKAGALTALLVDGSGDASLKIGLEWITPRSVSDEIVNAGK